LALAVAVVAGLPALPVQLAAAVAVVDQAE
jgi:hypothetical protein